MKKILLILLFAGSIANACQAVESANSLKQFTEEPQIVVTADISNEESQPTSIPTKRSTQLATSPISPTAISTPTNNLVTLPLKLEGKLWILHNQGDNYLEVINLATGTIEKKNKPRECFNFLFSTSFLLCSDEANQVYLFDPIRNDVIDLPVQGISWVRVSPDGCHLLYKDVDNVGQMRLNIVELCNNENFGTPISHEAPDMQRELQPPLLSANGNFITHFRWLDDHYILDILDTSANEWRRIDILGPRPLIDQIKHSPTDSLLLYGTSDNEFPGIIPATSVYIVDLVTGQKTLVANAPSESFKLFPQNNIWSPDGSRFFLFSENELCIFSTSNLERDCFQLPGEDTNIYGAIWSPNGEEILIQIDGVSKGKDDLMLFNVQEHDFTILIAGIEVSLFDWRP
ncbi:MAG: hypothetical protein DWQ07_15415 [Chloroflexi bacterium]|nr:MAG: hypothetical protein DWQ07_15415 [Chloroflexota bacterium]